jgi:malate dehydrogenase (oxaloacetate-decarboxylating)
LNKGTAFTERERSELALHGLLPHEVNTITQQERRIYGAIEKISDPLGKYVALSELQDRNEQLFHHVLSTHIEALMPIVYTPTVGLATQNFSQVFRRGRGVWITPNFRGRIAEILQSAASGREIRLIVATDNESILGIGDQGAGGMAIAIGKLALYTAGAGIPPGQTLPVSLDVGTDNPALLEDPLYLGWRERRLRGPEYDALIDEFAVAVAEVFPDALLQWEDFRKDKALAILDRHRQTVLSFNDDIQGTGAVALAGLLAALKITEAPLTDQRILIHGAGAAGLGISRQIRAALQTAGLAPKDASARIGVLDSHGLLVEDRFIQDAYKRELAWPVALAERIGLGDPEARGLERTVERFAPTVLIGTSGQAGAFGEALVRGMADAVDRPLIMPFSNPTDRSEARPEDLLEWTGGRALVVTGSPFPPVRLQERTVHVGQGNNVFIFPGLGLGALLAEASLVTDGMVSAAAEALANCVREEELAAGLLYPAVDRLREVSREVALGVARRAAEEGVAARSAETVGQIIDEAMWSPVYAEYTRA